MLKAAVLDGAQQLGLEQEVLEAAAVDAHVALLHLQHVWEGQSKQTAMGRASSCAGRNKNSREQRQRTPASEPQGEKSRTWAPSLAASPAVASSSASS